jgi:ATP-dependent DNA helicase RecG
LTKPELLELLKNGENSGIEFKRDDLPNHELAKALVALLNLNGGVLILGVEDDGTVSGVIRDNPEEWVVELCRTKIDPPMIPFLSWVRDVEPGRHLLAVQVPSGPDKPYGRLHNNRRTYFIRVGSSCREASRDELERMFQASGRLQYGLKPVPGASLEELDRRRLRDYFLRVLGGGAPTDGDTGIWQQLLRNMDLMTVAAGQTLATIDGMLLFGKNPKRFLPQSGVRAVCYPGVEPDYATRADEELKGPMTPLCASDGSIVEVGLVEQVWDFIRRNTEPASHLAGLRRVDRWDYPEAVIREAVMNALVHRDYSIAGSDVMLAIYADRIEIQSPGRLPNTVTLEGMKIGMRYARNQTLVNVMRDYRYVDFRGMGIRDKIIPGMRAHNGTEPDFILEETRFTLRLWKHPKLS